MKNHEGLKFLKLPEHENIIKSNIFLLLKMAPTFEFLGLLSTFSSFVKTENQKGMDERMAMKQKDYSSSFNSQIRDKNFHLFKIKLLSD